MPVHTVLGQWVVPGIAEGGGEPAVKVEEVGMDAAAYACEVFIIMQKREKRRKKKNRKRLPPPLIYKANRHKHNLDPTR